MVQNDGRWCGDVMRCKDEVNDVTIGTSDECTNWLHNLREQREEGRIE